DFLETASSWENSGNPSERFIRAFAFSLLLPYTKAMTETRGFRTALREIEKESDILARRGARKEKLVCLLGEPFALARVCGCRVFVTEPQTSESGWHA